MPLCIYQSLAGIAGSNPDRGVDVCLSCDCCVLSGRGLCDRVISTSRGVLQIMVCHCV